MRTSPLPPVEGLQRVPGAARLYGDVGEEILQIGLRLGGGLAMLQLGPVSGHDVPLGATGGEGVRGYYLYPRLGQVVPVLDALRIALPDNEGDDRVGDHPLILVLVPIGVNKLVVHQPRHVGLERERNHVSRLPRLHSTALISRRTIRGPERNPLASISLVKGRRELVVSLLYGRVTDQAEGRTVRPGTSCPSAIRLTRPA